MATAGATGAGQRRKCREDDMVRWMAALAFAGATMLAQGALAQEVAPIAFDSVPDFFKLPDDVHLGEASGVAVNSKGHVFVFSRGGSSHGPAFAHTPAEL